MEHVEALSRPLVDILEGGLPVVFFLLAVGIEGPGCIAEEPERSAVLPLEVARCRGHGADASLAVGPDHGESAGLAAEAIVVAGGTPLPGSDKAGREAELPGASTIPEKRDGTG